MESKCACVFMGGDVDNVLSYSTKNCSIHGFKTPLKDTGARKQNESGMIREPSDGKPRFDLTVAKGVGYEDQMLTRYAVQMAHGADKYDDRNWEEANSQEELDRFKESAFRHFMQWLCDEGDEDHAAGLFFNVMAYEMTRTKMKKNGIIK